MLVRLARRCVPAVDDAPLVLEESKALPASD